MPLSFVGSALAESNIRASAGMGNTFKRSDSKLPKKPDQGRAAVPRQSSSGFSRSNSTRSAKAESQQLSSSAQSAARYPLSEQNHRQNRQPHVDSIDLLPRQRVLSSYEKLSQAIQEFRNEWTLFNADQLADSGAVGLPLSPFEKPTLLRLSSYESLSLPHADAKRWDNIQLRLTQLVSETASFYDLERVIYSFGNLDYFGRPRLDVLHHLLTEHWPAERIERFFNRLLPGMIRLALSLPQLLPQQMPLLRRSQQAGACRQLSLTQEQIACLLANSFFCTFQLRGDGFPSVNLSGLFISTNDRSCSLSRRIEKLKCILNYMDRVITEKPLGVVTISRRSLQSPCRWSDRTEAMPEVLHVSATGSIEDTAGGLLEVDFANKFLGGGALGHGLVQEEIRFMICPELIVTRLVTECLDDNEALFFEGFERFSDYSGYADSFRWVGDHRDPRPVGLDRRRLSHLVAMDAVCFHSWLEQFSQYNINRELNKALVAFGDDSQRSRDQSSAERAAVATGNCGCGAFKGDVKLKFLIQLMACSVAGRSMAYFTFGDQALQQQLSEMYLFLKQRGVCVGGIYMALMEFVRHLNADFGQQCRDLNARTVPDLFDFVRQYVQRGHGLSSASARPLSGQNALSSGSYPSHPDTRRHPSSEMTEQSPPPPLQQRVSMRWPTSHSSSSQRSTMSPEPVSGAHKVQRTNKNDTINYKNENGGTKSKEVRPDGWLSGHESAGLLSGSGRNADAGNLKAREKRRKDMSRSPRH